MSTAFTSTSSADRRHGELLVLLEELRHSATAPRYVLLAATVFTDAFARVGERGDRDLLRVLASRSLHPSLTANVVGDSRRRRSGDRPSSSSTPRRRRRQNALGDLVARCCSPEVERHRGPGWAVIERDFPIAVSVERRREHGDRTETPARPRARLLADNSDEIDRADDETTRRQRKPALLAIIVLFRQDRGDAINRGCGGHQPSGLRCRRLTLPRRYAENSGTHILFARVCAPALSHHPAPAGALQPAALVPPSPDPAHVVSCGVTMIGRAVLGRREPTASALGRVLGRRVRPTVAQLRKPRRPRDRHPRSWRSAPAAPDRRGQVEPSMPPPARAPRAAGRPPSSATGATTTNSPPLRNACVPPTAHGAVHDEVGPPADGARRLSATRRSAGRPSSRRRELVVLAEPVEGR